MDNSPFVNLTNNLNLNSLWLLGKWGFVLAFGLYVGFALVVVSQVKQKTQVFIGGLNNAFKLLSRIHLIVAVAIFLWAVFLL